MMSRQRAFSLIEVLLAIFILGVGVISIAALFPAGIAQQRLSIDDTVGPIVANNAMAILRSKLVPDDFGYLYIFTHPTVQGDFAWSHPGFYGVMPVSPPPPASTCGINIFSVTTDTPSELHYNAAKYPTGPPDIRFTQGERYYPMAALKDPANPAAGFANPQDAHPQYAWDCMFRRFEGKILVAILVYRINIPGGAAPSYSVAPASNPIVPPIPYGLDLTAVGLAKWNNGAGSSANPIVGAAGAFNGADTRMSWMEARQWIVDQNNNIYRVMGKGRDNDAAATTWKVELVRPVNAWPYSPPPAPAPVIPKSLFLPSGAQTGVVTRIWFVPLTDTRGVTLTPVYATVKEL